jgi:hypothetical protein
MPIEIESPEEVGYGSIDCNLAESSFRDQRLRPCERPSSRPRSRC